MDDLKKRFTPTLDVSKKRDPMRDRIVDALVFTGFLSLSVLAIAAVTVMTPLVLALSALAGIFEQNDDVNGWWPAQA